MNEILDSLKSIISTYTGVSAASISETSTLEELEVDSIFAVELILEVQKRHGVRLELDDIVAEETLATLVERIQSAAPAVTA